MLPEEFQKMFNVSRETLERLQIYHDLLVKWQRAVNLVSPGTLGDIWGRHFADSAQLQDFIKARVKLADLGSGAGFPGMVLAILRPDLEIHLIESDSKKCEFLKNVSRETKTHVTVHNERVEKIIGGIAPDVITARAFAPLPDILKLVAGYLKGTELLLLKGKNASNEIIEAQKKFEFSCAEFPSRTDSQARILRIFLGKI